MSKRIILLEKYFWIASFVIIVIVSIIHQLSSSITLPPIFNKGHDHIAFGIPLEQSVHVRYLKYGSYAGWGNQLLSLKHALWLGEALNRTVILPPMLAHFEAGHNTYHFSETKVVDDVYLRIINQQRYIPMTSVLDLSWCSVPVIDYLDFNKKNASLTEVDLSKKYTERDTIWTRNSPDLIGTKVGMTIQGKAHTLTYRDLIQELEKYRFHDVITFRWLFREHIFDVSKFQPQNFNMTYSAPIRSAARTIMNRLGPYVAMHIRGSDGAFMYSNWADLFPNSLDYVGDQIEHYHNESRDQSIDAQNVVYKLLIITDMTRLQKHKLWNQESKGFASKLKKRLGIRVEFVYSSDYTPELKALEAETGNSQIGLCLDQQLAACAPVGFGHPLPMSGSSYLHMIIQMRNEGAACEV